MTTLTMRSTEFENWLISVSRPPRFLVVEDDVHFSSLVEEVSVKYDCIIDVVGSVREAKDELQKYKYRLLILDLNLPGESGMALLRYLKEEGIRLPIVMLSGQITQRDIDEARALAMVAWVTKPTHDVVEQLHELFWLLNVRERMPGSVYGKA